MLNLSIFIQNGTQWMEVEPGDQLMYGTQLTVLCNTSNYYFAQGTKIALQESDTLVFKKCNSLNIPSRLFNVFMFLNFM